MNQNNKILVVDDNPGDIHKVVPTKLEAHPTELDVLAHYGYDIFDTRPPVTFDTSKKDTRKCLLPSCNKETNHNGGYCCAEHCKEHREELKKQLDN